jgi:hypothetical protein
MTSATRLRPRDDAPRKHQLSAPNHQGGPRRRLTLVLLFEHDERIVPFGRFYLPEVAVDKARNGYYRGWAVEERLILTPGDVINFGQIEADILEFSQRFDVREIAYDP